MPKIIKYSLILIAGIPAFFVFTTRFYHFCEWLYLAAGMGAHSAEVSSDVTIILFVAIGFIVILFRAIEHHWMWEPKT